MSPHDCLYRLGEHLPGAVQILRESAGIEFQFGEPRGERLKAEHGMAHGDPQVAQHGRIAEIALEARHGQLVGEMGQKRIGHTQIAFGILEIDGVDLVRHGGGADLTLDHTLFEIAQRNVAPHVAREIEQHRVGAHQGVTVFGDPIVGFDLRGVVVRLQTQSGNEAGAQAGPVDIRERGHVGIEISDGTVHLAEDDHGLQGGALAHKTRLHVGKFLPDRGRGCGLAMGACQHAGRRVLDLERRQCCADRVERRQQQLGARRLQHQGVGEVVDVLGSAAEVHPLQVCGRGAARSELGADPVLDRLHVMVGARLDGLDRGNIGRGRIAGEPLEPLPCRGRQRRQRPCGGTRRQAQGPRTFDPHALAHQARLAEDGANGLEFAGVTAVERRKRLNRGGGHRRSGHSVLDYRRYYRN